MTALLLALLAAAGPFPDAVEAPGSTGIVYSGACTSEPEGLVCCEDTAGVRCGFPLDDSTPPRYVVRGYQGAPVGSTAGARTGGSIYLSSPGARRGAMTASSCSGSSTITIRVDAVNTVGTNGVEFDCSGTDAACAASVAAWVDSLSGVEACAGDACPFGGVSGTWYAWADESTYDLMVATNAAGCAALTVGENGNVVAGGVITSPIGPVQLGAACTTGTTGNVCIGSHVYISVNQDLFTGAFNGPRIRGINDSAATPGFTWNSDLDTGVYRAGVDTVGIAAGGEAALQIAEAGGETQFVPDACTFSGLGTPADLTFCFCSDCTAGAPCTGSGSGALALRFGGAWRCL